MTIVLALSALGVVATTVAFAFYQARLLSRAIGDAHTASGWWKAEVEAGQKLQTELLHLKQAHEQALKTLTVKEQEADAEREARKKIEAHRDTLLAELAKSGSPSAVAAEIRAELAALAGLGKKP
jgi:ribosomal protein S6